MVPGVVGATANFIDGVIYLCEGDYFGATLCFMHFASMGATSCATYALKAGKFGKIASAAVKVAMISEQIAGGLSFAQNAYNVGMGGIQMYCKYGILEQSFGLDTVGEVLGIGLSILGTVGGLKRIGSNSAEVIALKNAVGELKGGSNRYINGARRSKFHTLIEEEIAALKALGRMKAFLDLIKEIELHFQTHKE